MRKVAEVVEHLEHQEAHNLLDFSSGSTGQCLRKYYVTSFVLLTSSHVGVRLTTASAKRSQDDYGLDPLFP